MRKKYNFIGLWDGDGGSPRSPLTRHSRSGLSLSSHHRGALHGLVPTPGAEDAATKANGNSTPTSGAERARVATKSLGPLGMTRRSFWPGSLGMTHVSAFTLSTNTVSGKSASLMRPRRRSCPRSVTADRCHVRMPPCPIEE